MREMGVRGLLVYCSDYHCSHWTAISGDGWPDDVRLSDIELRFTCQACGTKGADLRPNFHWEREARQAAVPRQLTRNDHRNFSLARGTSWQLAHCPRGPGAVPLPWAPGRGRALFVGTFHLVCALHSRVTRLSCCLLTQHGPAHLSGKQQVGTV